MIHPRRLFPATVFCALMLAGVAACSIGPSVNELPPPNYSIAGVWELNAALSADEDKALASIQPKPPQRRGAGKGPPPGSGPGDRPAPEVINDPTTDLPPIDISAGGRNQGMYGYASQNDPRYQYRPPIDFQTNALLGGQWLKIQQSDTEVRISNAATNRSFTPGEKSVVSVTSGVADQVTGWKGRSYVVFLNPQIGPAVRETYTLTPDGRQLKVRIEVASEGRNKAMDITRTYDRSTKDPASLRQTLQVTLPPTD
jgi:hypothetical protein